MDVYVRISIYSYILYARIYVFAYAWDLAYLRVKM